MKSKITIKTKHLFAMLGAFGSICSVVSILISQSLSQSTSGDNSPNINGEGDINVEIQSAPSGKDWFEEYEKHKPDISETQFKKLTPGLTYKQVIDIIKIEGVLQSESNTGSSYAWGKFPFIYMNATFDKSGKLIYAINSGLF